MSRRGRLIGLAIALTMLANGVVNNAFAGIHKTVKACEPAKAVPVCKPVKVCEPVKVVPVCKPVKPLPLPEVCKPVKVCEQVDAHGKHVVLQERVARLVWRFKKHTVDNEVYQDNSLPTTSEKSPSPSPAPKPPTT